MSGKDGEAVSIVIGPDISAQLFSWLRARMAHGKKLLLILSVFAFKGWKHFPDRSREVSLLFEWLRSFTIILLAVD